MPRPPPSGYRPRVRLIPIVVGALWGAWSGLLLPRAAHRLSVDPEEPWNGACPDGHPITGRFGGWLGRARCTTATSGANAKSTLCGPYGPRTPVVSTATALICATLAAATGPRPELVVWLLAAPVAVLLALVDYRVHRLPDVLTLPSPQPPSPSSASPPRSPPTPAPGSPPCSADSPSGPRTWCCISSTRPAWASAM